MTAWRNYRYKKKDNTSGTIVLSGPNKYRNKKIECDGHTFDSKKEYRRYQELSLLQKAGEIEGLELQKKFVLIPAQKEPDRMDYSKSKRGRTIKGKVIEQECSYFADFYYRDKDGNEVVEDVKSPATKTPQYNIKRKLMLFVHNIRVTEI